MKLKHFSIIDIITTALFLIVIFGLSKLAHNDYLNSDYIGMALYILAVFGLIWVVRGWIKDNKKDNNKESRGW